MKKLIILIMLLAGQNLYSQTLKLTHPTGGEKFIIGSDTLITWEGVPETEPVILEFSNDNGQSWQTLSDSATGLEYNWNNIPNPQSDECIIRIKHISNFEPHGIEWEKSYGGSNDDFAYSIQQTTDGGYIVAGFTNSLDGDVSENKGDFDFWILKLRANGELDWENSFGGSGIDRTYSIQQTTDGGYIVGGWSNSTDGNVSKNKGGDDYWILKLNSDGELEWEQSFGGSNSEILFSNIQTMDGGYIVTGFAISNDGDVSISKGDGDYWIIKLLPDGTLEWEKSYGGSSLDYARSIQQTADGGYIVVGWTNSTNGDVSVNKGKDDCWILKLSPNGDLEWEQSYGGSRWDIANSIQQTTDGGYIVAGHSNSSDGDVSGNEGEDDCWIIKLRPDSDLEWKKSYGGSSIDGATTIELTTDGGYIVAGYSESSDGDVIGNKGDGDCWILKLSPNGDLEWEQSYGGSAVDVASSIQQTQDGGYIIAGSTNSSDSDVSENKGEADYWIVKLSPDKFPVAQSDSSSLFSVVKTTENNNDTLKLTFPSGGEKFLIGLDTVITWEGVPADEPVILEFSNDNGKTWQLFSNSATGLNYIWNDIPEPTSDECIIRVKHINTPGIEWEKSYGGSEWEGANSIEQTADGGYIVAGYTKSTDVDVSENQGESDCWILKLRADGELEWEKSYGGSKRELGYSIQQTSDGGYIVAGYAESSDGDVSKNKGSYDYWILKLRADGEIEWEKSYGGSDTDIARSIQQTSDGGYIVGGYTYSNDGDVSENKGAYDNWILKLTANGELDWEKSFGGDKNDRVHTIRQTADYGYILGGWTESSNGDISENKGVLDYWIIKLRPDGSLEWEKSYGGSESEEANSVQQTSDGGYIVAGYSRSIDVDVSEPKKGWNCWILKLRPNGDLEWNKSYGGRGIEEATSLQHCSDGGYIIAGYLKSLDGDVSENRGMYDYWILKLTSDGSLEWEQSYGGSSYDFANSIQQTFDSGYIVAGSTKSSDGDISENNGEYDYWIVKLYPDEEPVIQSDSSGLFSIVDQLDTASADLQISNISGKPGDAVTAELYLKNRENINIAGISSISVNLEFNPTLIYPQDYNVQHIDGKTAKITITDISINQDEEEAVGKIRFKIGLGNAENCDLMLTNPETYGGEGEISLHNGTFKLLGVCYEGGARLLNPSGKAGITDIKPNPAANEITIAVSLIEKGHTEIAIYNIEGEKVSEIYAGEVSTFGTYEFTSDISNLSNGTYYVIFQTPTVKDSKSIMIVR